MATDTELRNLYEDADVQNKSEIAALEMAAEILIDGTDAAKCALAVEITANPRDWGKRFLRAGLTQHKDKTPDQIRAFEATEYKAAFGVFVNGIIAGRA